MKLVDKMILLTRMLRDNSQYTLDIESDLQIQQSYYQNQSKFFKDTRNHEELDSVIQQMRDLKIRHDELLAKINNRSSQLLRDEEVKILRRDYDTFTASQPDFELMLERNSRLDPLFVNLIQREIGKCSDWRWAGIELNPSNGFLTRAFLANDPLYLYTGNVIDKEAVKSNFNRFFSEKRLMFCDNLLHLPQAQLGLAVSVNSYEFWPIDPIKTEMKKVYNLLLPGGHFIFSYNDCEQLASLDLCANDYRAYNTKSLMTSMVQMLGFDIVKQEEVCNGTHSFMIIKKPGKLTSQKLSSPIVSIETPKITELQKNQYNSDHERYNKK